MVELKYITLQTALEKAMSNQSGATPAFPDSKDFPETLPVELNSRETILIVVDMQNDFVRQEGRIYTGPMVLGIVEKIRGLLSSARQSDMKVIYTQSWYAKDDPGFGNNPKAKARKGGCMEGTWGAEIVDELSPKEGEPTVRKASYDCFYGTGMEKVLQSLGFANYSPGSVYRNRDRNTSSAIVTGTVSNVCVEKAVIGLYLRGFDVIVPADCIAASTMYAQNWALYQFSRTYQAKITRSDLIKIRTAQMVPY